MSSRCIGKQGLPPRRGLQQGLRLIYLLIHGPAGWLLELPNPVRHLVKHLSSRGEFSVRWWRDPPGHYAQKTAFKPRLECPQIFDRVRQFGHFSTPPLGNPRP
jgi:hypothetical protein